jgi:hypothetical protein
MWIWIMSCVEAIKIYYMFARILEVNMKVFIDKFSGRQHNTEITLFEELCEMS